MPLDFIGSDYTDPEDVSYDTSPATVSRTPYEEAQSPLASDYANYLSNVFHNSMAGLRTAASLISPDDETTKYNDQAADQNRQAASDAFNAMSPAGKDAAQNWGTHPLHHLLFAAEQQVPVGVPAAAASFIPGVGPALAAGVYSLGSATDYAGSVAAAVKQMSPEQKAQKFPAYSTLTQNGMTDEDATNTIIHRALPPGMAATAAMGAVTGYAPFLGGPLGQRVAKGFVAGAGQSAGTDITQGLTTGDMPSAGSIATSAGEAGLTFGGLSVLGGHSSGDKSQRGPARGDPVADTSGTGIGSDRTGRAPEKQFKTPGKGDVPTLESNTATPPAPDALAPDQRAALNVAVGTNTPASTRGPTPTDMAAAAQRDVRQATSAPTPTPQSIRPAPGASSMGYPATAPPPDPTTGVRPAPPPAAQTPTPQRAPPRAPVTPPPTPAVPERPETLIAQENALVNGRKEMVFYPGGNGFHPNTIEDINQLPPDVKANINIRQLPNGDRVLYRSDGPNQLTYAKILDAQRNNKLNDLLGYGPYTREDAAARVAQGETPAAVVERTPAGVEARAANGTDQTAPIQEQAMSATKLAPENIIRKENPNDVAAERLRGRAPQPVIAAGEGEPPQIPGLDPGTTEPRTPPITPEVTPQPAPQPTPLEKLREKIKQTPSPAAPDTRTPIRVPVSEPAIPSPPKPAPKKLQALKEQLEARKEKSPPTAAQLEAGNYEKGHVRFEGEDISIETGKGETRQPWDTKLKAHYGYIRGTIGADGDHVDTFIGPKGETGKIFVLNQLGRRGEFDEHKVFMGFNTKDQALDVYTRSHDNPTTAERRVGGIVELNRDQFKDWLADGDKHQPIGEGLDGEHPSQVINTHDLNGKATTASYLTHTTVGDALDHIDTSIYSRSMRPEMEALAQKLKDRIGDTSLYGMPGHEMERLAAGQEDTLNGAYDPINNHVMINSDISDGTLAAHTLMHEAFHAATSHALDTDAVLRDLATRLHDEVRDTISNDLRLIPKGLQYGLTSPKELLTEGITNPAWREYLKDRPMSPELAKDLNMPRWRKPTLYQGVLDWFRKLLGLSPRQYSILDGMRELSERALTPGLDPGARQGVDRLRVASGPLEAMFSPKRYSGELKDLPKKVGSDVSDLMQRTGLRDVIRQQGKRFLPLMDMVYGNEKYFGALNESNILRQLGHAAISMDGEKTAIKKKFSSVLKRVQIATRQRPDEMNDLHTLLQKSDFSDVDPRDPLGQGRNKHIIDKGVNTNDRYWEAIRDHKELSDAYKNLSPEGQKLFDDIHTMLKAINDDTIKESKENVYRVAMEELNRSDRPDAAELKQAINKVYNGEELDLDEDRRFRDDPTIEMMRANESMLKRQGFYFPSKRFGQYVVRGTHDYDVPKTGLRDPKDPDRIIFSNRQQAFDFVRSLTLPSERQTKYFFTEPDGTKRYTTRDDVRSLDNQNVLPQQEYHVIVNPKHVEFADSSYEGKKIADALRAAGVKDVKDPVLREQNPYLDYSLHAGQRDAFERAIDRMQHLTPEVRAAAKEGVNYMAATAMQGNRLSHSLLRKYNVAGADTDLLRTLDSHLSSAATYQARQKYMPTINKLLAAVKEAANNAGSEHALDMSSVVQEIERRLIGFKQGGYSLPNGAVHNVAALALWKYLFSPAHFALHLMHPIITSIPQMASEHGWGETYRAMGAAYRDMGAGRTMLLGGRGAWEKAWDFTKEPTDFLDSVRTRLQEAGRSANTMKMLDELEHDDYFTHMGLDFSLSRKQGLSYVADRSLSIMQELNNSAETINRVGTAVAAYDLALKKGLDHVNAVGYAKQVLSQTHGLYSNLNRAPFMMSHPMVRSMMQFKTFPMMIYRILARNVYNIYKNDTPGVRWQAVKALSGMIGTAALFTGAQGATPEPIRLAVTLTNMLGLTKSWEEIQDGLRRTLAETTSPEIAGAVMGGLGHVIGWDLHHRLGVDDLLAFGEPKTTSPQDVQNWFVNAALGTPWGLGTDAYTGYQDLLNGDYGKAANLLLPKALADLNKSYQLGSEGKLTGKGNMLVPEVGPLGLLGQALGFVPSQVSEAQQARAAYGQELSEQRAEREQVVRLWHGGDRAAALQAMQAYNQRHPDARMTVPQIRQTKTILGYPVSARNRQELEERARAYGM